MICKEKLDAFLGDDWADSCPSVNCDGWLEPASVLIPPPGPGHYEHLWYCPKCHQAVRYETREGYHPARRRRRLLGLEVLDPEELPS